MWLMLNLFKVGSSFLMSINIHVVSFGFVLTQVLAKLKYFFHYLCYVKGVPFLHHVCYVNGVLFRYHYHMRKTVRLNSIMCFSIEMTHRYM